jgi:hypothetical protein
MKLIAAMILTWLCLAVVAQSPPPERHIRQTETAPAQSLFPSEKFKSNLLGDIPPEWRARLVERLEAFLAAEREGAWDRVEELLGELYKAEADNANEGYVLAEKYRYSPEQKKWMMDKVRAHPILSYEIKGMSWGQKRNAESDNLKVWFLEGEARYPDAPGKKETNIVLYHYNGDWFLLPEVQDNCGVPEFLPPPEFSERERTESLRPRLSFAPQPDLPIQIFDIGKPVSVHENWPCSLNQQVAFKVRNLGEKEIVTYHYRIEDSRGRLLTRGGTTVWLPPGQVFDDSGVILNYRRPCVLYFEGIDFKDGTKWKAPAGDRYDAR